MRADPFGPDQMRTIAAVANTRSFSRAASMIAVTQSAVSQQVRSIEEQLKRRLFNRTRTSVELTADGEAYLVYARAMQKVSDNARRHFEQPVAAGSIRLGLTEDFARTILPNVLAMFGRDYPSFTFTVDCGLSTPLFQSLDAGHYDLVVAKRPTGRSSGERLWSEPMRWFGAADMQVPVSDPIDLVLMPRPSETRDAVIDALQRAGRTWRCMFQCASYGTLEAAVKAGVGVAGLGLNMHGPGLTQLGDKAGLPPMNDVDVVMEVASNSGNGGLSAFSQLLRETSMLSVSTLSSRTEQAEHHEP